MRELVDTHAHLNSDSFEPDRDEVIARATEAGVTQILVIGTTLECSQWAVNVAARYSQVYAVVGIQPNYVHEAAPGDWEAIRELSLAPKVVGLGETGLDCYWKKAPLDLQRDYFARHIELARERDLPFVVHMRDAEAETVEALRQSAAGSPLRGVMHSFTGGLETASACLELGLHISFAGMVTFKNAHALRDVAKVVPTDRILVETDSPYLAPSPYRGKRNEPSYVTVTASILAETRGESEDDFAAATTRNARDLFRLPVLTA